MRNSTSILFQAVQWIGDLFKVLIKSHVQIGCNVGEIQSQKDEHLSIQETAKVFLLLSL